MNKTQRTASVRFIFITILLDAIGIGLLIPVLPDVLRRFFHESAAVSAYFGVFISVYALMQFLASPILGSLSDRYGRKSILLISLFGAAIDYVVMAFAPNLSILFIGRVISGLTGASLTVASSYMADISTDKDRSANFGMIGAAWGVGFIAGPLIGGLLSSQGPTAPFLAAAVLNFLNFLFGVFVLPESLPHSKRRTLGIANLNPFTSLKKILKPSPYSMLIWIYFLLFLGGQVHPSNWTLYTQTKFGWSAWQVGLSLSFVGVVIAISQGGLTRIIIPRYGEERSLTAGIVVYVVSFALFAFATRGWMMYALMVLFSLSGVAIPALQSIVARHVPPSEQGELQGSLVSLGSMAAIIGPLFFTTLFVSFTKPGSTVYFPGAAYAGAALICAVALVLRKGSKPRAGQRRFVWPTREEILQLPPFDGLTLDDIAIIMTPEGAQRAYDELMKETVVGFDTESKPTFQKGEVSRGPHVVQFSTTRRAYIFMLHLEKNREVASALINSPALKKVGFGLGDDLKRIPIKLGAQPKSVLDLETLFSARGYGRGVGVKVGVAIMFKRRFMKSKKASTSNWMNRHLTDSQILYAANDAYAAIKVYEALEPNGSKHPV